MYPMTISIHTPAQFNAVAAALAALEAEPKVGTAIPESIKKNPTPSADLASVMPKTAAAVARAKSVKDVVNPDSTVNKQIVAEAADLTGGKNAGQAVEALDNQHANPPPTITFDQLKGKFQELGKQADGRQKIIDVLARFGVQKLPALKPDAYDAASALIDTVMAGGEV